MSYALTPHAPIHRGLAAPSPHVFAERAGSMPRSSVLFLIDGKQSCSMPECGRLSSFHVRLETVGPACPLSTPATEDSCGTHLTDVAQALTRWAIERRHHPANIVVYAIPEGHPEGQSTNEGRTPGPFDRLVVSILRVRY
jgi:hypothetical protein